MSEVQRYQIDKLPGVKFVTNDNYVTVQAERDALAREVEAQQKQLDHLAHLLVECRDALPAISVVSARLHRIDLSLADRIEEALEPWRVADDDPRGI